MKKLLVLVFSLILSVTTGVAKNIFDTPVPEDTGEFNAPIPAEDDEVTQSGPNTKLSLATQMRYDAFQNAEVTSSFTVPEDKMNVKIFQPSKTQDYLQKVKISNAKIIEYTNGSYDIKFKDFADMIFSYDKNGDLIEFSKVTNKGKVPFVIYHYDKESQLINIEIKPERYRSYVYDLNGLLVKFHVDDKVYAPNGKMLLRKKGLF